MSKVAVDVLPFLPFLIFLCVDKKWGYRFLTSYLGADLLNGAVKLTVCILLTGFSRNFLGVHTPQDVIVGLTEGIVMILIVRKASQVIGDNEKATIIPALGGHWGNLISRFGMVFIGLTLIPMLIMKSAKEYQAQNAA